MENVKRIALTRGKFAIVDADDFEYLSQWKWNCNGGGYAVRGEYQGGGRKNQKMRSFYMHAVVNKTPKGKVTDHKNRNKLDNRKSNLRTVDHSVNGFNRGKQSNNTSGFKGVYWYKNAWVAEIKVRQKKIHLGRFKLISQAVSARRLAEDTYCCA